MALPMSDWISFMTHAKDLYEGPPCIIPLPHERLNQNMTTDMTGGGKVFVSSPGE